MCRVETSTLTCFEAVNHFTHAADFNAIEYFQTDRNALVCGSFSVSLSFSMPNLIWPWEWSDCREVFAYWVSLGCIHYLHTNVSNK